MVKIKDFTLASKNLGGHVPPMPYTPMDLWGHYITLTLLEMSTGPKFSARPGSQSMYYKICTMV